MYVTYLGFRIERRSRHRIDIRDNTGRLVQRKPRWADAIEWIDLTDQRERRYDIALRTALATAHFE